MGKVEWKLVLNNPVVYTGQTLSGVVVLDLQKTKQVRSLYVTVTGKCKVKWFERSFFISGYEKYSSSETYKIGTISLLNKLQKDTHTIEPGHYEYPFQCVIPAVYPSTFQGKYGCIRYKVKVMVNRKVFDKQLKKTVIQVIAPLDLNDFPDLREPVCLQINKTYSTLFSNSGAINVLVRLPAAGYYPGDTIPIEISYENNSSVTIERFFIQLTEIIIYRAQGHLCDKTRSLSQVYSKKQPNKNGTVRVRLEIPNAVAPNLQNCKCIVIFHKVTVTMTASGVHRESKVSQNIILGTVPPNFTGYTTNPQ